MPELIGSCAEFNFYADPFAAAHVLALTSPDPASTTPLQSLPEQLARDSSLVELESRRLPALLFPLDITERHPLLEGQYLSCVQGLASRGSPLAQWHLAFMSAAFEKMRSLHHDQGGTHLTLALHDALCVWYAIEASKAPPGSLSAMDRGWSVSEPQDIRVETSGQWSRGACITDRRTRKKAAEVPQAEVQIPVEDVDEGGWLSTDKGNRVRVCLETPGEAIWPEVLLGTIFGSFP